VSGIKGRKVLIWFTPGIPLIVFPAAGVSPQGMTDYDKELRRTADLLNAAEVAVYPVAGQSVPASAASGADKGPSAANGSTSASAVAEATGGVAYSSSNGLQEAVAKAIDNGSNYYTLSYVPPNLAYDGRFHAIEVEVERPGVHLQYRRGYNADNVANNEMASGVSLATAAAEPYGDNMQASMARGVPSSGQLMFDVLVAPSTAPAKPTDPPLLGALDPKLKGKPLIRYDVQYLLPSRQIVLTSEPGGLRKGSLRFEVKAYDAYGKLITDLSQTLGLSQTPEQYQEMVRKPFQFFQQVDLPHGEIFVRVGILDGVSNKLGTLEIPLMVTKHSAAATGQSGGNGGI
jgi:hypothetical protein